jgi:hypothetical protein
VSVKLHISPNHPDSNPSPVRTLTLSLTLPLSQVNLLRKRRLRPVRGEEGLRRAVLEEVAVQALGLGLGFGLGLALGLALELGLGVGVGLRVLPCSVRG